MASGVVDSILFKDQFSTEKMRTIFSDENMVQKWLDTEAALARAQAKLGIIPADKAAEICRKAKAELMDFAEMKRQIDKTGHPIVPLLRVLKNACDGDAGEYVHWGATTQDIMDTGMILQVREAFAEISAKNKQLMANLCDLAEKYKSLVMVGRTHGQHALPVTLGFKCAVWAAEVRRNIMRLEDCRGRLFIGQFSGAVGTIASLGAEGMKVQELMLKELGLGVPDITWHTSRDNLAEFISVLGIVTGTAGKIANEVVALQKTEFSELEEPFVMGKVGSSTMPHKRNPMLSENVVALSKMVRSLVPLAQEAMIAEHERDMRGWQTEWDFIGKACCLTDAALKLILYITEDLIVRPQNIERNLYILKGLMLSEAIMMKLGEKIGRQEAHEIVYKTCMEAFAEDAPMKEALLKVDIVAKNFSDKEIDSLLNPHNYTGLAEAFVEKVLAAAGHRENGGQ
jgi:adenylosuccinate lyase